MAEIKVNLYQNDEKFLFYFKSTVAVYKGKITKTQSVTVF